MMLKVEDDGSCLRVVCVRIAYVLACNIQYVVASLSGKIAHYVPFREHIHVKCSDERQKMPMHTYTGSVLRAENLVTGTPAGRQQATNHTQHLF